MYGKIFESAFAGTLYGSGPTVFAVWSFVIATAKPPGAVELNPKMLAACIGTDIQDIRNAIGYLCQPDPDSRNQEEDGRRLMHLVGLQYQVVSFEKYRLMRSEDDRRAYMRDYMRDYRSGKQKGLREFTSPNGKHELAMLAEAEAEAEAIKDLAENGREPDPVLTITPFERFWKAYPRKAKKPAAQKAFMALSPTERTLRQILTAIDKAKESPQWKDGGGKYIPHPATWINNRCWEDELPLAPEEAGHRNAVAGTRFVA